MQLRPMLSSLRHHKLTVLLLTLQVAFTCAIVCNASFLIVRRLHRIHQPSGLQERGLSVLNLDLRHPGKNPLSMYKADVAALRMLPGVASVSLVDDLPLSSDENSSGACGSLDAIHHVMKANSIKVARCAQPAVYSGGPDILSTLGLKLVAGRDFHADEFVPGKPGYGLGDAASVIISQRLAHRLYPQGHAVGRQVYYGGDGFQHGKGRQIVGVVQHLQRGRLHGASNDQSMLVPSEPDDGSAIFVLRSKPDDQASVIKAAEALLDKRHPDRLVSRHFGESYTQIRAAYFQRDTTMISLLLSSALGLLFVTALGIAGLASFWVQQRRRSIGIRRAIGATRADILRYFQTENFLIVTGGAVLGLVLAWGLNLWLMHHYELSRLPWMYLPIGAAALWLLGQLSVLGPALRASRVPPVVATRSV